MWASGEDSIGPWTYYGPGVAGGKRGRILVEESFAAGDQLHSSKPIQRDGVSAEGTYGIIAISKGWHSNVGIQDRDLLAAVYHGYDEFIAEFNSKQPDCFFIATALAEKALCRNAWRVFGIDA